MQVEIFTLCDAATVSHGMLNVLGSFDTLHSSRFPFAHPRCAVAVKLRFDDVDTGSHSLETRIIDLDGRRMIPSLATKLEMNIPDGRSHVHRHIWHLQGLHFRTPGEYSVDLLIDGEVRIRHPLYVCERERKTS